MTLTKEEAQAEWQVTVDARLGELCGRERPTPDQLRQARREADRHLDEIRMAGELPLFRSE